MRFELSSDRTLVNMQLAVVLATLPVIAAAELSMPALARQDVSGRESVTTLDAPASQPAAALGSAPAKGEIAVTLINSSGEVVDYNWFGVNRLNDGKNVKSFWADKKDGEQFIFTDLDAGRYEVESKDFATGYADVENGKRTTISLSLVDQQRIIVSGRVARGIAGVADAEISALLHSWPQPRRTATRCDAAGYFLIPLPVSGDWVFNVRAPRLEPTRPGWNIVFDHDFAVPVPMIGMSDVHFAIPQGRIDGSLFDSEGRTLADHPVCLTAQHEGKGSSATRTDASGKFVFLDVSAGNYRVSCGGAVWSSENSALTDSPVACTEVSINATAMHVDGVELRLVPAGELELELVAPATRAAPAWSPVVVRPVDAPLGYWNVITETIDGGLVRLRGNPTLRGLPAGTLELSFRGRNDRLAAPLNSSVTIAAGGRTRECVELVPATNVAVRACDAGGMPQFIRVADLRTAEGRRVPGKRDEYTPLARLTSLPPGEYVLRVADPAGRTYEQTIQLDGEPERDVLFQL